MLRVKLPPPWWFAKPVWFATLPIAAMIAFSGSEVLLWARHFDLVGPADMIPDNVNILGYWLFQESEVLTIYNVTKISFALGLLIGGRITSKEWIVGAAFSTGFLGGIKVWDDFHDWADMLLGLLTGLFCYLYLRKRLNHVNA